MAVITGTFNSLVSGTITGVFQNTAGGVLSGVIGTPGPTGNTGATGATGSPGPGVAAGGSTGQYLVKASGTSYDTAWLTLPANYITSVTAPLAVTSGNLAVNLSAYSTTAQAAALYYPLSGNPSGFLTASALTPYLTSATAASTYQTLAGMSSYLTTATAASTYYLQTNPAGFIGDAPSDGSQYARQDGAWSVVTGGGGGSFLPLAGGTMTGAIIFDGTSGQYISKGNFDTSRGGNYGISLVCSIGYEFNWQAGWLTTTAQSSVTPRPLYLDSLAGTTLRAWNSSTDTGVEVSHTGITFADNSVQTTAGFVPGSGDLNLQGYSITDANFSSPAGQVSAQNVTMSIGGVLTFGDNTVQTTAYTGGGGGLPVVQIAASAINPSKLTFSPNPQCVALTYTTHTDVLNGTYAATLTYSYDSSGNPTLTLSGLTSLITAQIVSNASMTSAPGFSGLTSLTTAYVYSNASMTSAPDFTGLTALTTAYVYSNASMTSAPDFTGCTALYNAQVNSNASMTSAPSFTGLTALYDAQVNSNASMTSAPDFSGCTALYNAQVYSNASMTSAPDFTGLTALTNAYVSSNASMTSAPDFTGLTSLYFAQVNSNASMTSAPSFSGCTFLTTAYVSGNASMTSAPGFTGLTSLYNAYVNNNDSMTSAPSFTGCTSLYNAQVNSNASMTSAPDFSGCTALFNAYVSSNASMTSAPSFSACTSLRNVYLSGCAISDSSLLVALQQVYDYASENEGYFDCSGGTNGALSPAATEIIQLQGAYWTIVFNSL